MLLFFCFFCILVEIEKETINDELLFSSDDFESQMGVGTHSNEIIPNESNFTSMQNYFSSLDENIGFNAFGTCGLIGIGMLLSYYDTFWDDSLIEERFDCGGRLNNFTKDVNLISSPGIINDKDLVLMNINDVLSSNSIYEFKDYKSFVNKESYSFFHLFLLKKALENEKINISYGDGSSYIDFELSMNYNQIYFMLEQYIKDANKSITIDTNEAHRMNAKDYAIAMLQKNIPVLMGIYGEKGGHVVVAYKYDKNSDTIFFHSGLEEYGSYATLDYMGYDSFVFSMALTNFDHHLCSNNIYSYDKNAAVCVCQLDGSYPSHKHDYSVNFTSIDKLKHYETCPCGVWQKNNHTVDLTNVIVKNGHRYSNCIYCGELLEINIDGPIVGIKKYGLIL